MEKQNRFLAMLMFLLFAFFLGSFLVDQAEERIASFIVLFLGVAFSFIYLVQIVEASKFGFLIRMFFFALALRVLLAFLLHYFSQYGMFAEDDYYYNRVAWRIAQSWKGNYIGNVLADIDPVALGTVKEVAYGYFLGAIFYVFGNVPLAAKMTSCVIGSLTVVYLSLFTWEIFGEKPARTMAYLTACFPSMILWSSLALKDPIATFCIVFAVHKACHLLSRFSSMDLIKMGIALGILGLMRGYMFILVGGCVALSFALRKREHLVRNYAIGIIFLGILFFVYQYSGFGRAYVEQASFEQMDYYRKSLATGGSAIHVDADISSPGKALMYLPIGVTYFLFAPFPWAIRGLRQLVTLPEVLVWYVMFYFFILGMREGLKVHFQKIAPILSVMVLITLTYSLIEGNLGTAYRHRAQIMGFYLMFTAFGIHLYRERKGKERELVRQKRNNRFPVIPRP